MLTLSRLFFINLVMKFAAQSEKGESVAQICSSSSWLRFIWKFTRSLAWVPFWYKVKMCVQLISLNFTLRYYKFFFHFILKMKRWLLVLSGEKYYRANKRREVLKGRPLVMWLITVFWKKSFGEDLSCSKRHDIAWAHSVSSSSSKFIEKQQTQNSQDDSKRNCEIISFWQTVWRWKFFFLVFRPSRYFNISKYLRDRWRAK